MRIIQSFLLAHHWPSGMFLGSFLAMIWSIQHLELGRQRDLFQLQLQMMCVQCRTDSSSNFPSRPYIQSDIVKFSACVYRCYCTCTIFKKHNNWGICYCSSPDYTIYSSGIVSLGIFNPLKELKNYNIGLQYIKAMVKPIHTSSYFTHSKGKYLFSHGWFHNYSGQWAGYIFGLAPLLAGHKPLHIALCGWWVEKGQGRII